MRTVPNIGTPPETDDTETSPLQPLETAIRAKLIPALANERVLDPIERAMIALPPRLGGMGIPNSVGMADL